MPLVNVRLIEGVFTPEQKSEIIHGITEAMVAVEGEALCGVPGWFSRRSTVATGVSVAKG